MASLSELVVSATEKLKEQKFCEDFIRKYSAIWRKLLLFAENRHIEEFSWEIAQVFFREEYGIDIDGDDIYQTGKKKLVGMVPAGFLFAVKAVPWYIFKG